MTVARCSTGTATDQKKRQCYRGDRPARRCAKNDKRPAQENEVEQKLLGEAHVGDDGEQPCDREKHQDRHEVCESAALRREDPMPMLPGQPSCQSRHEESVLLIGRIPRTGEPDDRRPQHDEHRAKDAGQDPTFLVRFQITLFGHQGLTDVGRVQIRLLQGIPSSGWPQRFIFPWLRLL